MNTTLKFICDHVVAARERLRARAAVEKGFINPPFTPDAFIDAITDFIIANDQVSA